MPRIIYKTKEGKRVSGVTTVIGAQLAWNKGALMWWAWKEGQEGRDFRETRDKAADLGTCVHKAIEQEVRTGKHDEAMLAKLPDPEKRQADYALLGFFEWRDAYGLEVEDTEISMVSEIHEFGGTMDQTSLKVATNSAGQKRRIILDLKTSKDVYPDHRIQLSAYGKLWNELHPDDPVTGYHLLRVGKNDGGFAHHYWPSLEKEWEVFLSLLELHALQKEVK